LAENQQLNLKTMTVQCTPFQMAKFDMALGRRCVRRLDLELSIEVDTPPNAPAPFQHAETLLFSESSCFHLFWIDHKVGGVSMGVCYAIYHPSCFLNGMFCTCAQTQRGNPTAPKKRIFDALIKAFSESIELTSAGDQT
jgi:hypothetical protein